MAEHFLLKNTVRLPDEAIIRSNQAVMPRESPYITKTFAAPGDDDDYESAIQVINGWNNSFATKTNAAPGDDDDYGGMSKVWSGWESHFF